MAMLARLVKRKAKPAAEALFILQSGAPLTYNSFVTHIKEALRAVHLDPTGSFAGLHLRGVMRGTRPPLNSKIHINVY